MNSVNHPSDFVVNMQTLDRIEDSVSVASDTGPVLKSAVPNVTSAPVGTKFGKGRRQVGFRNSVDDDETFRKVAWKGHSTPFRSTYREEFTPISIGGSQGCYAPPSPLQWDYHDLGFPSHNIQTPVRNHSIPQQIGVQQTHEPTNFIQVNPSANFPQPHSLQHYQIPNAFHEQQVPFIQQSQYLQPSNFAEQGKQVNHPSMSVLNDQPTGQGRQLNHPSMPVLNNQTEQGNWENHPSRPVLNHQLTGYLTGGQYVPRSRYQTDSFFRNSRGMNRKPPDFDGGSSFHDFWVQFEPIAEMNSWDNFSMANELAACLQGAAVSVLSDLQPAERRSYDALVLALKTRIEPDNQNQLYRAQLKSHLRHSNESLPSLAQDIRKLVRLSNPSSTVDLRESLAKDFFLDAQ